MGKGEGGKDLNFKTLKLLLGQLGNQVEISEYLENNNWKHCTSEPKVNS
jgi:hypothetical protein